MAYVKGFDINGINTIQTACIELQAPPNAATEGAVGLLAIDMSSPTKDVYKCVAVNGAIYTWELLSAGMSILSSSETGEGASTKTFTYTSLRMNDNYVVKVGDLILDSLGFLYRITALGNTSCVAEYCYLYVNGANGVGISSVEQALISDEGGGINRITIKLTNGNVCSFDVRNGQTAYELAVENGYEGTEEEWLDSLGYDSWLKGKAITQAEYDALPESEKNKSGFLYVIKDAESHVDTADKLALKTTSHSYLNGDNNFTLSLTTGRAYMVHVVYDEGFAATDIMYISAEHKKNMNLSVYIAQNYQYYCDAKYTSSTQKWTFVLYKQPLTESTIETVKGYIYLYEI